jgi:uncharacterized protein
MNVQKLVKERLIIFTRYPEPGKVKTRLIPALGESGATTIHRQMAEHTIAQARQLRAINSIAIEVHFTDDHRHQEMIDWLGLDLVYQTQSNGDLGARMAYSFDRAFRDKQDRVILIGTDCPGLNPDLMQAAFYQLLTHDLVLGPAIDGGYYLIGLRRFIPELFVGIQWGSSQVYSQTMTIANRLNLSIAQLLPLADVDRVEDLPVWKSAIL